MAVTGWNSLMIMTLMRTQISASRKLRIMAKNEQLNAVYPGVSTDQAVDPASTRPTYSLFIRP